MRTSIPRLFHIHIFVITFAFHTLGRIIIPPIVPHGVRATFIIKSICMYVCVFLDTAAIRHEPNRMPKQQQHCERQVSAAGEILHHTTMLMLLMMMMMMPGHIILLASAHSSIIYLCVSSLPSAACLFEYRAGLCLINDASAMRAMCVILHASRTHEHQHTRPLLWVRIYIV